MANTIVHQDLQSDFATALATEIATALDGLCDGYLIEFYGPQNGFDVRDPNNRNIKLSIYIDDTKLIFSHFSHHDHHGRAKCQTIGHYEFTNPTSTPEAIAHQIAYLLRNTLPYHQAVNIGSPHPED
jgi:hypothetical protein